MSIPLLLYRLDDDGEPTPMPGDDIVAWSAWWSKARAAGRLTVRRDEVDGLMLVSSVFIGTDMAAAHGSREPLLYETMAFGPPFDGWRVRSTSRAAAMFIHGAIIGLSLFALSVAFPGADEVERCRARLAGMLSEPARFTTGRPDTVQAVMHEALARYAQLVMEDGPS